ncbi:PD-(D/E)XK motif protein [Mesorhizobium sp. AD1-1]|uniref:PD-(D/E)XK motif protein n=1 Tax=Mesorhizobium sp. AD1-1 TaxID=2876621 RepID=UPI001CCCA4EA|nr:PD-(D/E)XK motif protein [Mesorhizobium sp. AD1-1]MBZ9716844.1 PD-(D/E)XK motif protein [Mesorhizobium sp. AD1-1]
MTDWLVALNKAWDTLAKSPPVSRQYRSKLISTEVPLDVLAAMRATDNAPCLMLQTELSQDALFELGGMRLSLVPDTTGIFLVLSLEDSSRRDLFATICADVVSAAALANRADALDQFLARLDAWRQFLRDRRDGLSRSETVGLIGELIILGRILTSHANGLSTWQAPNDGLHDFVDEGHALEIKTGLGPSSTITISALDQLDVSGLSRLDLMHVRLIETPEGKPLRDFMSDVSARLPNDTGRRAFENALLSRGLMPDDNVARAVPKVQLRAIDSYQVQETFPRLVRANLPVAITDATYSLEVRAIAGFATDTALVLEAFVQGDPS